MKVVQVGRHFIKSLPDVFVEKTDIDVGTQEQSIIVKNVVVIMVIYLKMVQNQLENVIATMACAWFLNLKANSYSLAN